MVLRYILTHPYVAAAIWAVLYTGDYYLTIYGAKLFKAQKFVQLEGSYELNPLFQKDIDKLKLFNGKFIILLLLSSAFVWFVGINNDDPYFQAAVLGALLIMELAVWMRHITNIALYRYMSGSKPGVSGHIVYGRQFSYRTSALQLACLSGFTLICWVVSGNPMLLGGSIGIALCAIRHWRDSRRFAKLAARSSTEKQ